MLRIFLAGVQNIKYLNTIDLYPIHYDIYPSYLYLKNVVVSYHNMKQSELVVIQQSSTSF
jgi:hypothetical protein